MAAYSLIAEKGFEGFRTRDVAAKVGINSATLHYYFPTKESLVQAVVEHLMKELRNPRAPVGEKPSAAARLRAEFNDIRIRLKQTPEQLVVLTELAMRAWRDPAVARILHYLDEGWRNHLISIFEQGIAEKIFRSDLDPITTASTLMAQLRGLGFQAQFGTAAIDKLVDHIALQTEHWVRRPRGTR